jgi:hypothetical protein
MMDARPGRDILLELRHLRPEDPLPAFDGGPDGGVQRLAEATALGLKIDEGNRISHEASPALDRF